MQDPHRHDIMTAVSDDQPDEKRRGNRAQPVTAQILTRAAATYVTRYATSTTHLRRVLQRRVQRATHAGAPVVADAGRLIDSLIAKYVAAGVLDDEAFAQRRAAGLRQRGESRHRIGQRLAAAGIDREAARTALAAAEQDSGTEDPEASELAAAIRFARRRRLGPFRNGERAPFRLRDLAAMGRAGFPLPLARKVIDAEDPAQLLDP